MAMTTPVPKIPDTYRLRVFALEVEAARVRDTATGDNFDLAAVATHAALGALYDLYEAHFDAIGIKLLKDRDAHLAERGGEDVGALALARGAKTHELMTVATVGGFGDLPYGTGPYGGGWLWAHYTWTEPKFQTRAGWYAERVQSRHLWDPLDRAWWWFCMNLPPEYV